MKKSVLFIAFVLVVFIISAQTPKIVIGIPPFSSTGSFASMEPVVYDMVSNAFNESGRFTVVERSRWDVIDKEKDIQKGEDFLSKKGLQDAAALGAEFIVIGSIANLSATKKEVRNNNGQLTGYTYAGYVSLTLKVVNVQTGQVVSSKSINEDNGMGGFNLNFATSPQNAITKVIRTCSKKVKVWIGEAFPVKMKVVKILEQNGKSAKVVLVSGGSENGITEKTNVRIVYYEEIDLDGKKISRPVDIAEGKIIKVEDQNFSDCKIQTNGQDVQKKIDEGKQLFVITIDLK